MNKSTDNKSTDNMALNEPGNGEDPWQRGGDEPNDLDQIVRDWQRRFGIIV